MSRHQNGNVTALRSVTQSKRKCHAIKTAMSQRWMEYLAAHEDDEVKVNQEHFLIRIPFYQSMSQWYHIGHVLLVLEHQQPIEHVFDGADKNSKNLTFSWKEQTGEMCTFSRKERVQKKIK